MEEDKIRKWIRIIAVFIILSTFIDICCFVLIEKGIIDESLNQFEVMEFYICTMMGLIIFIGLWSFEPWGWKLAIILIPLSWAVYSMTLFVDYERGLGLITAPFLVVDALILNYLFKSQVSQLFNIISTSLFRMQWLVKALLLLALFLSLKDIFGGLVGLITIIVIPIRPWSSKKNDKKLTKSKIYPRDEPDGGNYAVYRKNREGLKGILPACYPQRYARTKPFA